VETTDSFGLIVIGDEILLGTRRDRHVDGFRALLDQRGFRLAWVQILPDDPALLIKRLRSSMVEGLPVFSCGGIGATPDDHTRRCAAEAAGVPLVRHPEAVAILEDKFGADAYPNRILMAELPEGSDLVPNPVNRVPGFSIHRHYFVPGFPDMAHPMASWVLEHHYADGAPRQHQRSVRVFQVPESELMPLMEEMIAAYPELKLFSLPRMGEPSFVELGFRGTQGCDQACDELERRLTQAGLRFEPI
jgi:molybdopterin-biosynthesis enzyme MoeA-like protein